MSIKKVTQTPAKHYPKPVPSMDPTINVYNESLRHQMAQIMGVARLLDNIAGNRYENEAKWEEFGVQVETLAGSLVKRLMALEEWINRAAKPSKSKIHIAAFPVNQPAATGGAR